MARRALVYRGHILLMDAWEAECAGDNEAILRKMAVLEEFTEDETAYMTECHAAYDHRREEVGEAWKTAWAWLIWSLVVGTLIYGGLRLALRKIKKGRK